jgi:hypothetical protein
MKMFLKITLFTILGLLVLVLLVAAFLKKDFSVERSITINKTKTEIYDYVKYLKNQNNFSVWAKLDTNMKQEYRGTDGTVGFVSLWDSPVKSAGKGEQEIIKIEEGERIDYELRFLKPMKATNYAYLSFSTTNDSTAMVKWGIFGKMAYPTNIMGLFMNMDEMLGKDLEGGLKNLKALLEEK